MVWMFIANKPIKKKLSKDLIDYRKTLYMPEQKKVQKVESKKQDLKELEGKIYSLNGNSGGVSYYFKKGEPYTDFCDLNSNEKNQETRKYFQNWSYDSKTRTFTAEINWNKA